MSFKILIFPLFFVTACSSLSSYRKEKISPEILALQEKTSSCSQKEEGGLSGFLYVPQTGEIPLEAAWFQNREHFLVEGVDPLGAPLFQARFPLLQAYYSQQPEIDELMYTLEELTPQVIRQFSCGFIDIQENIYKHKESPEYLREFKLKTKNHTVSVKAYIHIQDSIEIKYHISGGFFKIPVASLLWKGTLEYQPQELILQAQDKEYKLLFDDFE